MIKVYLEKKENKIHKITIKGHALYDDFGKDIVCAGVSSILITTINGILKIDQTLISYTAESGSVTVNVLKQNEICFLLLENMMDLLNELQEKYKKNIKIEEVSL